MIRDIATATLTRHGYRVLAARDGTEAVAIFAPRAREIRLVITDLNMPNLDGAALARVARRLHPSVKILAMSGLSSVGTDGAFPATAVIDAFLSKPFTLESLLNAVHEQLKAAR
jgi:CheY-like chemotaxis protein